MEAQLPKRRSFATCSFRSSSVFDLTSDTSAKHACIDLASTFFCLATPIHQSRQLPSAPPRPRACKEGNKSGDRD
ncbi:MAG: hypothetical protein L6R41_000638 [Letrouitia leprolyta]|nr:MAG: hypothetical protein L6R41_000638 [Letrouitia leprolyta]